MQYCDRNVCHTLQDYVTEISSALVEANSMAPEALQRIEKLINEVVSAAFLVLAVMCLPRLIANGKDSI